MPEAPINKTMDPRDLERDDAKVVVQELNELIGELRERRLPVSAWYGAFDLPDDPGSFERVNRGYGYEPLAGAADDGNFPWFLYWEIAWVVVNNAYEPGDRLLDMGGSSSLFSYYLASKGVNVVTVDLQEDLVANANEVARKAGWPLENHVMDMTALDFEEPFDHVASNCDFEHLPLSGRIKTNRLMREVLKPGGSFSITFDYRNPARDANIRSPHDVREQFVDPSGLSVRGNQEFHDSGESYLLHPFHRKPRNWRWKLAAVRAGDFPIRELARTKAENDYTFGSLFMRRD
jgi:SAM-dependent methyltransferase